jgi:DDE superfamily endonuclease
VAEVRAKLAPGTPIEVWCQDEMRVGQKNKLTYRWARKGSRPRAIHDQRTQSTYLFGAVCPERGTGAALVLPACNSEAMQLHLDEIATKVTAGAHAIVLLDQAGWHGAKALKVPSNISLLLLPPRAPELNGQENVWQFMRQNWLSNRIFKSFDDIVDHCCYAWNTLIDQPWKIMSIAHPNDCRSTLRTGIRPREPRPCKGASPVRCKRGSSKSALAPYDGLIVSHLHITNI